MRYPNFGAILKASSICGVLRFRLYALEKFFGPSSCTFEREGRVLTRILLPGVGCVDLRKMTFWIILVMKNKSSLKFINLKIISEKKFN